MDPIKNIYEAVLEGDLGNYRGKCPGSLSILEKKHQRFSKMD